MKREVTTRIEDRLMDLVKGTARGHRISLETFFQMSLVAGLAQLGVKVDEQWVHEDRAHRSLEKV